mmetsp:Transcript_90851/g.166750  ORF Transcript_90851/g.166750 Transcript_90851/m.166750 type:complete len:215 (+) Transcript_90851:364-1008(+)
MCEFSTFAMSGSGCDCSLLSIGAARAGTGAFTGPTDLAAARFGTRDAGDEGSVSFPSVALSRGVSGSGSPGSAGTSGLESAEDICLESAESFFTIFERASGLGRESKSDPKLRSISDRELLGGSAKYWRKATVIDCSSFSKFWSIARRGYASAMNRLRRAWKLATGSKQSRMVLTLPERSFKLDETVLVSKSQASRQTSSSDTKVENHSGSSLC